MAKTIRNRSRGGYNGSAAAGKVAANNNTTVATPGIQELQDLMDAQQGKMDAVKASYAQQNTQLARSNSALLMKLTDFEKKISELVQENVILRTRASMNEYHYKERLNEQISILEEGISRRFDEIFHMFNSIRRKENLPSAPMISSNGMGPKSILKNKRTRPSSGRASSIHFQDPENNDLRNPEEIQAKKKRKSSRRESIFMPEDFDFGYGDDQTQLQVEGSLLAESGQQTVPPSTEIIAAPVPLQQPQLSPSKESSEMDTSEIQLEMNEKQIQDSDDGSLNFTNAIIDYSIPEESAAAGPNSSTEAEPPVSSSKLEIFRDEPELDPAQKDFISTTQSSNNKAMEFKPLEASQNKVKHSMRPLNTKGKKIVDEVMPSTNGNGACGLDFPRTRRTRGKAIDYTLPSLRAKMRRPSEKLVDATTFTNIQDLQVTYSDKKSSKESSRKSTISPEPLPDIKAKSEEPQIQEPLKNIQQNSEPPKVLDNDMPKIVSSGEDENRSQDYSFSSSTSGSGGSSNKALKDITNTPKLKQPPKTRKLFKNAIINDLCDRIPNKQDQPHKANNNERNVSFRLHEEDLSVFDLIGSDKVKHPQKTYRSKSRRKA